MCEWRATMIKGAKQIGTITVAALFTLTVPAFAGSKGGGGNHAGGTKPSENMSLNYSKVEHTYSQQSASKKTGSKTGKAQLHDLSITKKTDKASPN